jgi:hypothetical protein
MLRVVSQRAESRGRADWEQVPLVETPSAAYMQRTEWNVPDSGETVVFSGLSNVDGRFEKDC